MQEVSDFAAAPARRSATGLLRSGLRAAITAPGLLPRVRIAAAGAANAANVLLAERRRPRFHCPCCGQDSYAFEHKSTALRTAWHSTCPHCGSRSRHRALARLLPTFGERHAILHFAPEHPLVGAVRRAFPDATYTTTDLHRADVTCPGEDIQALTFADRSFDLVVCNHVLEHVRDDEAAMHELARILRDDGLLLLTLPGDWTRSETISFPNLDLNGHHRDYGTGVADVLAQHFGRVQVVELRDADDGRGLSLGIRSDDRLFVCSR